MQVEIQYRSLVPSDYDQVIALWQRCEGMVLSHGDDRETFSRYLERNEGLSFAALRDGVIVGAVLCGHDGRRGLIYHLAVAPESRGQGIARQITSRGLEGLRKCGLSRVLILVLKDNTVGQDFWIAQGFEQIDKADAFALDLS